MAGDNEHGQHDGDQGQHFVIFVDEVKFEVRERKLTGAQIKGLAGKPDTYQLFLERPGKPDELIDDAQVVEIHSNEHFHTVPPAQFG